jgi:hypothetical protein
MDKGKRVRWGERSLPVWATTITVVALGFVAAAIIVAEATRRWERAAKASRRPVASTIAQEFGVEVRDDQRFPVTTHHGLIGGSQAGKGDVDRYRTILETEFLRYPPALIRQIRLRRIVLCRELSFAGQNRSAIPDFEHDTLYFDVVAGGHDRTYQRRAIHHELFHIIDYEDDGELDSDARWAKLNPPTFRYGRGGEHMLSDAWSGVPWDRPSFLNKYSTSGIEEDKAEIFAYMVTEIGFIEKRAVSDDAIRKKMSAMKVLLSDFCPDMNESFWKRAASVPRRDAEKAGGWAD